MEIDYARSLVDRLNTDPPNQRRRKLEQSEDSIRVFSILEIGEMQTVSPQSVLMMVPPDWDGFSPIPGWSTNAIKLAIQRYKAVQNGQAFHNESWPPTIHIPL